jgi:hypothetical protein
VGLRTGLDTALARIGTRIPTGWEVSWTSEQSWTLPLQGFEPGYPLDRRLGGPQNRPEHCPCKDSNPGTHWIGD